MLSEDRMFEEAITRWRPAILGALRENPMTVPGLINKLLAECEDKDKEMDLIFFVLTYLSNLNIVRIAGFSSFEVLIEVGRFAK